MQIWVDADACPLPVKEVLFRTADRTRVTTTLVANKPLRTPYSEIGGPPPLAQNDRQAVAGQLDRFLARQHRE